MAGDERERSPEDEEEDTGTGTGGPRRRRGFSLNPLDYLPNLGFGGILMVGLIVGLGFFMTQTETGRGWLRGLIQGLPAEWRAAINNFFPGTAPDAAAEVLTGLDAEAARERLTGNMFHLPEEVANVLAPDDATWRANVAAIQEATGGQGIAENTLTSPDTIYNLMTRNPRLVINLVRALPRDAAEGQGQIVERVRSALTAIVSDRARFNALMSTEHRGNMIELLDTALRQQLGVQLGNGKLLQFVNTVGLRNGAPTDEIHAFITGLLSSDEATRNTALVNFARTASPDAIRALFAGANFDQVTDPNLRQQLQAIAGVVGQEGVLEAAQQVVAGLPPEKAQQLMAAVSSGQMGQVLILVANDAEIRTAIRNGAQQVAGLPADMQQGVDYLRTATDREITAAARIESSFNRQGSSFVGQVGAILSNGTDAGTLGRHVLNFMLDPNGRALLLQDGNLGQLGVIAAERARQAQGDERTGLAFLATTIPSTTNPGQVNYVNLVALTGLTRRVSESQGNQGANMQRTMNVLYGMIDVITAPTAAARREAIGALNPAQVAAFFRNPDNAAAFGTFLGRINISALPREQQAIVRELREHWGNLDQGLAEVFADERAVSFILDRASGRVAMEEGNVNIRRHEGLASGIYNGIVGSEVERRAGRAARENRDALMDVVDALTAAGVTGGTDSLPGGQLSPETQRLAESAQYPIRVGGM